MFFYFYEINDIYTVVTVYISELSCEICVCNGYGKGISDSVSSFPCRFGFLSF